MFWYGLIEWPSEVTLVGTANLHDVLIVQDELICGIVHRFSYLLMFSGLGRAAVGVWTGQVDIWRVWPCLAALGMTP